VLSEIKRHGLASRRGQHRADLVHQALDPVVVAGAAFVRVAVGFLVVKRLVRRVGRR
jgi:hypothetical protein